MATISGNGERVHPHPPLALPVVIDEDLLQYEQNWAAAGTPRSAFPIAPDRLVEITMGRVAAFAET